LETHHCSKKKIKKIGSVKFAKCSIIIVNFGTPDTEPGFWRNCSNATESIVGNYSTSP